MQQSQTTTQQTIKAAEQRLSRLVSLLRTASGESKRRMLQKSVDAEHQRITQLKIATAAPPQKTALKTRVTKYVTSTSNSQTDKAKAE